MDQSTTGPPIFHCLPELCQINSDSFDDTVQPSHPLSSPSPLAFTLSQHQRLFLKRTVIKNCMFLQCPQRWQITSQCRRWSCIYNMTIAFVVLPNLLFCEDTWKKFSNSSNGDQEKSTVESYLCFSCFFAPFFREQAVGSSQWYIYKE